MKEIVSGIYQIRNNINGKKYIGSEKDVYGRIKTHLSLLKRGKHHSKHLQSAWNLYGEVSFSFELIECCEGVKHKLIELEQRYIDFLKPEYNVLPVAGSCLGRKISDETKRKMSDAAKGRVISAEQIERIRVSNTGNKYNVGKKRSNESRMKMSISHKGKTNCLGVKHTAGARANMSKAHKGKKLTQQHKDRISMSNKGRVLSKDTRAKMSAASTGKKISKEQRLKQSLAMTGRELTKEHKDKLSKSGKAAWLLRKTKKAELAK